MTEDHLPPHPLYGIIDPDYARIYTKVRCIAWGYGYAAVMHGSFTRDLDILIVPWAEHAQVSPDHLIRLICDKNKDLQHNGHPPTKKPHGRIAYTLIFKEFGDPRFIDISFTLNPKWVPEVMDAKFAQA